MAPGSAGVELPGRCELEGGCRVRADCEHGALTRGPALWMPWNAFLLLQFAFIKATEGTTYTDSQLAANWAGANAAGLTRGVR